MGWKALTKQPVTTARSGRWKQEMFQEDLFLFEFLAKGMLLTYEYEPSDLSTLSFSGLFLRGYALIRLGGWYSQALLRKVRRSLRLFPTY